LVPLCSSVSAQTTRPSREPAATTRPAVAARPAAGVLGGIFGGRGNARFMDDVRVKVHATDEEWKVIGPKLQKVVAARQIYDATRATAGNVLAGRGGGGGARWQADGVSQAYLDLRATVDDPKTTPEEIQTKLKAVREARQKARADMDAVTKDLLELLTPTQEAILVSLGYLD
ncbi:MAG: hypothetical protein ACHRHE_14555, partial [Tepidisphaerales bacterium]